VENVEKLADIKVKTESGTINLRNIYTKKTKGQLPAIMETEAETIQSTRAKRKKKRTNSEDSKLYRPPGNWRKRTRHEANRQEGEGGDSATLNKRPNPSNLENGNLDSFDKLGAPRKVMPVQLDVSLEPYSEFLWCLVDYRDKDGRCRTVPIPTNLLDGISFTKVVPLWANQGYLEGLEREEDALFETGKLDDCMVVSKPSATNN
jgi:hypothetical protein